MAYNHIATAFRKNSCTESVARELDRHPRPMKGDWLGGDIKIALVTGAGSGIGRASQRLWLWQACGSPS